ncbi:MAG TPA: agenet domain-containing protein, partial [Flavisolibacter sp.]|nr:agenet domain-containing protein [Flavisolibacter sp.]
MRKNIFTTLLFICLFAVNLPAQTNFKTGDQAEVSWNGVWYKAQVLEVKDGKYKINYLGYGDSWDEWVDNSRIRRTGQQATAAQTASNNSGAFKPGDL